MALVGIGATRTQIGLRHNLDIKETGSKAEVKDDCRIKLMYYLNCFSSISKFLQVHPEWRKYTEYETKTSWTIEEEEELYHICNNVITVSVVQAVGFIEVPDDVLQDCKNEFYDITNTDEVILNQVHVHLSEDSLYAANRVIGGRREIKLKVMMYRKMWIDKYYYTPLRELSEMINRHKQEKREEEEREREEEEVEAAIKRNKYCCCVMIKKNNSKHPNLVKFILFLYFIHALAIMFLFLNAYKRYDEFPWLKWVHLAGCVLSLINIFMAGICMILVCISCYYENWIICIRMLIKLMTCISMLLIPITVYMLVYIKFNYFVVGITQILISITISCFSGVLWNETYIHSNLYFLCCYKRKVSPELKFNV